MNILVQPFLDGIAGERLRKFAIQISTAIDADELRRLAEYEAVWARRSNVLNGQSHAYEAAARLLVDLRLLKWKVRADVYGLELESPPHPRLGPKTPDAIRASKEALRRELAPGLHQQFSDSNVQKFITELENPPASSRRKNIALLIADGSELNSRLSDAISKIGDPRKDALRHAVKPYLQLVPGEGEALVRDEFTDIPLGDIWRYFRYTWSIPHTAIPGRQMFYLVRDRAHACHAIIGIACLGNSPLMSPERDDAIGWTPERFRERLEQAAFVNKLTDLDELRKYLEMCLGRAIDQIATRGLANTREISDPDENIIARLQRRADEFSNRREEALREVALASAAGVPLVLQETELGDYELPPVSLEVLELEGRRAHSNAPQTLARQLLVAKKRAFELARLLRGRLILRRHWDALVDPARILPILLNEDFGFVLSTALFAAKSNRVGTNILEVTTCGAVAPYSHLLGGKLVALLLLSPEVADDYRNRYGKRPSIISSQLKNEERTKDCTLAWLNTTSLYSMGSSQYERLRLPAGTISDEQAELRYTHIGDTVGFGTVQFSDATAQAVQAALQERFQFRGVNSIFGEGFSPKFRKLREGMEMLGFNPAVLMRHDQQRRVYAVPIWSSADAFLRGEGVTVPDYVREPQRFRSATERIAEFWRTRWLAHRLDYMPAVEATRVCRKWTLSDRIRHLPAVEKNMKPGGTSSKRLFRSPAASENSDLSEAKVVGEKLQFWKELAGAGPEVCADELSEDQLSRLHVAQPLDKFLLEHVQQGFSIVLTGNAGDGKTHLLRRLEPDLKRLGAEIQADATAAMQSDDVGPIISAWKKAVRKNVPYCIAANEYPLHLLRQAGKGFAPLDEVERQCAHRLMYGVEADPNEDAKEKVLVVDLSLRNPLTNDFARPLFEQLVGRDEIRASARSNPDSDLAWNLQHLGNQFVRNQLLALCARLAAAGYRATVRELWIWATRLIFGGGSEDNKPVRSPGRWYSSRLFDHDERFGISALFRSLADPATHSHPRWDLRLEAGQVVDGWQVDGRPQLLRMDASNFAALKRRFYFEHFQGKEIFDLEGVREGTLLGVLQSSSAVEAGFKHYLIESINLAYCPTPSPHMTTRLYLWIGHRYHEQPSRGYVANQSIADTELELLRPRLPRRLTGAFDYQPDHLLLRYRRQSGLYASLRVDHSLFASLEKLKEGLPRQLLADREVNRLDSFIEQLRRIDIGKERTFFIHNHEDRTTTQVELSPDFSRYEKVKRL